MAVKLGSNLDEDIAVCRIDVGDLHIILVRPSPHLPLYLLPLYLSRIFILTKIFITDLTANPFPIRIQNLNRILPNLDTLGQPLLVQANRLAELDLPEIVLDADIGHPLELARG